MKEKYIIQLHSRVDVITNSSSELFSIAGNSEIVKEFITEYISKNGREYSGDGGSYTVHSFREYVVSLMDDINLGYYEFSDDVELYMYNSLGTFDEKFKFVLDDYIADIKKETKQEIDPNNIDNLTIIDIDWANQDLIKLLKETFSNYIFLG